MQSTASVIYVKYFYIVFYVGESMGILLKPRISNVLFLWFRSNEHVCRKILQKMFICLQLKFYLINENYTRQEADDEADENCSCSTNW